MRTWELAASLMVLATLLTSCTARSVIAQQPLLGSVLTTPSCADCTIGASLITHLLPNAAELVHVMQSRICLGTAEPQKCRNQAAVVLPVLAARARSSLNPAALCANVPSCSGGRAALLTQSRPQQKGLRDGPTCAMCTFLINRIKLYLNDTAVQQTILDAADKACSELPAEFAESCTQFVNTYEPILLQYVEATDPSLMCMLVGVCLILDPAPTHVPPALPLGLVQPLASLSRALATNAMPSNDYCDVCKMAVIEAHSLVTNPNVQASLVNYTKTLCGLAGGPFTHECDDFVDAYAPAVFTYAEELLDPSALCLQLGVCRASLLQSWRAQAHLLTAKLRLGQSQGTQGEAKRSQAVLSLQ